jgi:hypothetical protein
VARADAHRTCGESLTANRNCRRVILVARNRLGLPVVLVTSWHRFLGWTRTARFLSCEAKIQN